MGGLVARYFCEHLGGVAITRRLITIGTLNRGAARAPEVLVNGMYLGGMLDLSGFVRSLPLVYELLPQHPVLHERQGRTSTAIRLADAYGLGDRLTLPRGTPPVAASGTPPAPCRRTCGYRVAGQSIGLCCSRRAGRSDG